MFCSVFYSYSLFSYSYWFRFQYLEDLLECGINGGGGGGGSGEDDVSLGILFALKVKSMNDYFLFVITLH